MIPEFHHPDRLGTRMVTNPSADTLYLQSTLPFGTAFAAETTGSSNRLFTSYDRSPSTGLDYAVNRTYSLGQGRFTTPDPIGMASVSPGDPQSLNQFAYTRNSPTDFTDPSGLNLAGPNAQYGNLDPFGVSYYVDGILTDPYFAWAIINGGAADWIGSNLDSITIINRGEKRRNPANEQWEIVSANQSILISPTAGGIEPTTVTEDPTDGGGESTSPPDDDDRLKNCALAYYGIDPISVGGLSNTAKWGLIALGAGGIPKGVGEWFLGRGIRGLGSSGFTSVPRILSATSGYRTLKLAANFAKKWTGPIAVASLIIDGVAVGTCYVWR